MRTLYVGVTNDIERRDYEHKNKSVPGFTSKYRLDRLVYFENTRTSAKPSTEKNESNPGGEKRRWPSSNL